jgi:hypothetical protein
VRLRVTARPTAPTDRAVTGWLVWTGERHRVRVPVSVRPAVVAAPRTVAGAGARGRVLVVGRAGTGRTVRLGGSGLVAATSTPLAAGPGPTDTGRGLHPDVAARPRGLPGRAVLVRAVRVPAGTELARFAVTGSGRGAVDLQVLREGRPVAGRTADVRAGDVTLTHPAPGLYQVRVSLRGPAGGWPRGRLDTWVVPRRGGSALTLSTDAVRFAPGRQFRYTASWRGLTRDRHYLAVVTYRGSGRRTLLTVN